MFRPHSIADLAGGWLGFAWKTWQIGLEASIVVPLRVARLATGDKRAGREAQRMVNEKVVAHTEVASALASGNLGHHPGEIAANVAQLYLTRVRANRRRLLRRIGKG